MTTICSADGCNRREPCGPYCRDAGNFDRPVSRVLNMSNTGHGHVTPRHATPRDDGAKTRCGGPAMCKVCQSEKSLQDIGKVQKEQSHIMSMFTLLGDEKLAAAMRAFKKVIYMGGSGVELPADSWIELALKAAFQVVKDME